MSGLGVPDQAAAYARACELAAQREQARAIALLVVTTALYAQVQDLTARLATQMDEMTRASRRAWQLESALRRVQQETETVIAHERLALEGQW